MFYSPGHNITVFPLISPPGSSQVLTPIRPKTTVTYGGLAITGFVANYSATTDKVVNFYFSVDGQTIAMGRYTSFYKKLLYKKPVPFAEKVA